MAIYDLTEADKKFSANFKTLRTFFHLTNREMAELLNYKSPSNINYFEKIPLTNRPSYQILVCIQELYGISIDWLFGLQTIPFTDETLTIAEKSLKKRLNSLSLDFTNKKFTTEQKLQNLLLDLITTNAFIHYVLSDRFVLLFLINYLDNELCKSYTEITINREEKYHRFKILENQKVEIRKHPEFIQMLELFHQETETIHTSSILDPKWNFTTNTQEGKNKK